MTGQDFTFPTGQGSKGPLSKKGDLTLHFSLHLSPYVSEEFSSPAERIPVSSPGGEQLVEKGIAITKTLGLPLKKGQEIFMPE